MVLPILCIIGSVVALIMALCSITLAIVTGLVTIVGVFAIVILLIGFTIAVADCGLSFALTKSKLCLSSGIISAIAMIIDIVAFILLM